jgi:hypothetical protein
MVSALAAAGIGAGLSALGSIFGNSSRKKAAREQQRAIDSFNQLNASEFDRRLNLIRQSGERSGGLADESFGSMINLRREAGDVMNRNRNLALDEDVALKAGYGSRRNQMDRGFTDRMRTINGNYYDELGGIDADQAAGVERSFRRLGAVNLAERGNQFGLYKQGTRAVGDATAAMGVPEFNAARSSGAGMRTSLLNYASGGPTGSPVPADGKFAESLARHTAAGEQFARTGAEHAIGVSSFGDALRRGDRTLSDLGSDLDVLSTRADRSRAAYERESAAAKLVAKNYDATAEERRAAAAADAESFLTLLADEQARDEANLNKEETRDQGLLDETTRLRTETDEQYFADLANTLMSMFEGLTQAEADLLAKQIASSENRVGIANQLTQFKVGNTQAAPSILASLVSGAGSGLISAGLNKWVS